MYQSGNGLPSDIIDELTIRRGRPWPAIFFGEMKEQITHGWSAWWGPGRQGYRN